MEGKYLKFADKIKIPADELDLLFWSKETGEIFKWYFQYVNVKGATIYILNNIL